MTRLATPTQVERMDVMGTHATITAVRAPGGAATRACARLRVLHDRWSRFDAASEISRLNRNGGRAVGVSDETLTCVALAVAGWQLTDARFDPTVHDAEIAAGYDRTFTNIGASSGSADATTGPPSTTVPGCDGIKIDGAAGTITLPPGVHLDLGGIAKGYATDLLAAQLMAEGAHGACVDIGGDLRVWGTPPDRDAWEIAVADPSNERHTIATLIVRDGAVATTSRIRRSWRRGGADVHHLIDPATGRSAWTGLRSVTAIASEGWCAEVAAKTAFMAGADRAGAALAPLGARALLVNDDGVVLRIGTQHRPANDGAAP